MARALRVVALVCLASSSAAGELGVARYDLTLRVDCDKKWIHGVAHVDIEARGEAAKSVRLALNDRLRVTSFERDGKKASFTAGDRIAEGRAIEIALDPPLAANAKCRLTLSYEGEGQDPDQNGADWMGVLLVRDDEVRMSHQAQWYPILPRDDAARAKWTAPVELVLDLPAGFESLGPGNLEGVKKSKGREIHTWSSDRAVQASLLAGKFKAQNVKRDGSTIRVLSTPAHAAGAKLWAEDAAQSLASLGSWLGKLEGRSYGIGEMRILNRSKSYNYEADGFSVYDGVLFDGRAPDLKKIAHEVAHMWFGSAVDAVGEGERFLTEGLAEYAAWRTVEARSGVEAARDVAAKGLERYFSSEGAEHALAQTDFGSPRYAQVAYTKGAFAMRTLRAWIGDASIDAGLREFVNGAKRKNGVATLAEFVAALRAQDSVAVEAWEHDWLSRAGTPSYALVLDGRGGGKLVQHGELYRNPVELELKLKKGGHHVLVVQPTSLEQAWTSDSAGAIDSVVIDPRLLVLFRR